MLVEIASPTRRRVDDAPKGYAPELAAELERSIEGEVRFDSQSRALYSTDGSNYRQVPIGVVVPRTVDDVAETVRVARAYGAPILARGGGTSLAGQCCNVAVVLDFSKYLNRILELDPDNRIARVQPGIVLDELRDAAEKHHLTFGPDPATHTHCTLGGMIGNNSCGIHSMMAGKTVDNVEELEILTYDGVRMRVGATGDAEFDRIARGSGRRGEIYRRLRDLRDRYTRLIRERFPEIPRRVSGYNLPDLLPEKDFHIARALVGSECTCVTVLEATVRLVYSPPVRSLLVLGYRDVYSAGDHVTEILEYKPIGLEGLDDYLIDNMKRKGLHPADVKLLPDGGGWLLVEFGGESKQEADGKARQLMDDLKAHPDAPSMKLFDDPAEEKLVWEIRESGLGATAFVPGEPVTWEGWEDSAVPPRKVGPYLRDLRALYDKFHYKGALYGHFGQGCIHTRISFDFITAEGIRKYRRFMEEASDLVLSYGGSLSGEHGDGQSRAELLPKMFGPELMEAFREFKSIWDPDWKMNPGKVVEPYRIDENLRLGPDYNPPDPPTHFRFPEDGGTFAQAALRCVGVGECRRHHSHTMCPSYRVTMEEKHSTRGRARLLFEMMQGEVIRDGWRSEEVKDALDLCLACKGCKGDCPVNVDMATYKAEFLSHYYEGRLRPRSGYAMGLIHWWARAASIAPWLANLVTQTPGLSAIAKASGGIAQERTLPKFAPFTFRQWFRSRPRRRRGGQKVMLWPDTFNNFFHPHVAAAAVEVLEDAGCEVVIPRKTLCCGRPLYDYGMLDTARMLLEEVLEELKEPVEQGVHVVGLEPSCAAVFRDELTDLFPHREDAKRLKSQTLTLGEFLANEAKDYRPPALKRKAIVHGHCHQAAVMGMGGEVKSLQAAGVDAELLDSGCCGMAGSFGFEADHYGVSMKVGELVLLPKVRETPKDAFVVADGFSCSTQIEQATGRRALHLAEVLKMAKDRIEPGDYPERAMPPLRPPAWSPGRVAAAAAGIAVAAALGFYFWRRR